MYTSFGLIKTLKYWPLQTLGNSITSFAPAGLADLDNKGCDQNKLQYYVPLPYGNDELYEFRPSTSRYFNL